MRSHFMVLEIIAKTNRSDTIKNLKLVPDKKDFELFYTFVGD